MFCEASEVMGCTTYTLLNLSRKLKLEETASTASQTKVQWWNRAEILALSPHLCTRIYLHAMIGLLKKPSSICQSRWKKIQNILLVIQLSLFGAHNKNMSFTDVSNQGWINCSAGLRYMLVKGWMTLLFSYSGVFNCLYLITRTGEHWLSV